MPLFDLPLEQLHTYTSAVTAPADFDAFWDRTVNEARRFPLDAVFEPVDNYLSVIDTFDVTFGGYGGSPVKGWLHLPANRMAGTRLPAVVQYAGYSGGRGLANQDTKWAQAGYAHFIMDTRGQGYGGSVGETADPHPSAGEVAHGGLMTRAPAPAKTTISAASMWTRSAPSKRRRHIPPSTPPGLSWPA